jgi:anti-anti-sigma factor
VIATHTRRDGTLVCKPLGVLDWSTSLALGHVVDDALMVGSDVVIDLVRVRHIDASGLTAVFRCMRRVHTAGGTVQVINRQPQVRRWINLVAVAGATNMPARPDSQGAQGEPKAKQPAGATNRPMVSLGLG